MPRLGWRRLDLSLARAARARLRRLGRARPPRRAGRGGRRRRGALRARSGAEIVHVAAGGDRGGDARRSATRPPSGFGLRATGPHGLRSGRDGALPDRRRVARPAGSRCGARTASCARCSMSRARRRAPTAPSTASPVRVDATNPETARGPDPGRDPAAAAAAASGRRREPARARRGAAAAPARRSRRRSSTCSRRGPGTQGGRPRWRHSRRPRVRHAAARGNGRVGAVDARDASVTASRCADAAPGGSSGGPAQEGAGSARGREGAEGRARRLAGRRLAATRWSPCRGSPSRPAGTASSPRRRMAT